MKLKHFITLAAALLLLTVSNMDANEIFPDTIKPSKSEISGEYYDWTKTMAWHFNIKNFIREDWLHKPDDFSSLPAIFSASTPMQSETEIKTDPKNLTGLPEQFCMSVVPWYYKRNPDVETDGDVIISKKLVVCPVLWNEKAVLVYGKKRYFAGKKIELPSSWGGIQEVQLYELTLEGLEWYSSLLVHENVVKLDIRKDLPVILLPH